VAVFCDGDFWHGRDWDVRRQKLQAGANSDYWIAKIERNRERDLYDTRLLEGMGFTVLRFWESRILENPTVVAQVIIRVLEEMPPPRSPKTRSSS
jgi:DNA mismatch endonuclease (patch repair protein)